MVCRSSGLTALECDAIVVAEWMTSYYLDACTAGTGVCGTVTVP